MSSIQKLVPQPHNRKMGQKRRNLPKFVLRERVESNETLSLSVGYREITMHNKVLSRLRPLHVG